jgi:RNA polymerase sigma factor for flagellar operon FliA
MPADQADAQDGRAVSRLLLESLDLLDGVVRFLGRRHALSSDEEADLASEVKLKLLDDDHALLRSFRHSSSLKTFLVGVAHHTLVDQLQQRWGKWRPSAAARRLGPAAIELERLVHRDQRPKDEAFETLVRRGTASREELERIHALLPSRERRSRVDDGALAEFPAPIESPEAQVESSERQVVARRVSRVLDDTLAQLESKDALLLRLSFSSGFTVTRIAELWGEDRRHLYRRIESLLRSIRRVLEAAGIDAAVASDLIATRDTELHVAPLRGGEGEGAP